MKSQKFVALSVSAVLLAHSPVALHAFASTNSQSVAKSGEIFTAKDIVDDNTLGFYNEALGTVLDGTQPQFPPANNSGGDPTIFPAPEPDLSTASSILGGWLSSSPIPLNSNWSGLKTIPKSWLVNTESAIIYPVDAGTEGIAKLRGNFGVDNGIFVWVNGKFKFGALAPGAVNGFEYANIDLGSLPPGINYIQILREDHGDFGGYTVKITGIESSVIADSELDFNNSQGTGGWYYGYWISPFNSTTFQQLPDYSATPWSGGYPAWFFGNRNYWTRIGNQYVHPNGLGTSSPAMSGEHWVARRWISTTSGQVTISGKIARGDSGGDGVTGHIFIDGVERWTQYVNPYATAAVTYAIPATINVGAVIEFVVSPGPTDNFDTTLFTASIRPIGNVCEVPFFWQRDPAWRTHPLQGTCGSNANIGDLGCTLTSTTMVFRHLGIDRTKLDTEMTPPNLGDAMGKKACLFDWWEAEKSSSSKAVYRGKSAFSYSRLDDELNKNHRPVILGMSNKNNSNSTHWIVVVGGQGTDSANYTIWDPWYECGQNMRLNGRTDSWNFDWIATYQGQPTCSFSTEVPVCALSVNPVSLPPSMTSTSLATKINEISTESSALISGTATVYRATGITMTIHLTSQSSISNVTDILIWSDTLSNTIWQPFTSYVWLPQSNLVYARFRDGVGNVSDVVSDTINPSAPPVAPDPVRIQLPLVRR